MFKKASKDGWVVKPDNFMYSHEVAHCGLYMIIRPLFHSCIAPVSRLTSESRVCWNCGGLQMTFNAEIRGCCIKSHMLRWSKELTHHPNQWRYKTTQSEVELHRAVFPDCLPIMTQAHTAQKWFVSVHPPYMSPLWTRATYKVQAGLCSKQCFILQ